MELLAISNLKIFITNVPDENFILKLTPSIRAQYLSQKS